MDDDIAQPKIPSFALLPFYKKDLSIDPPKDGYSTSSFDINVKDKNGITFGTPISVSEIKVRGPGDVLGFDRKMIARLEPKNGTDDFEPNYFTFVEFVDPDFPWRYSLDPGGSSDVRRFPWLSLIVLKKDEFTFEVSENTGRKYIKVSSASSLPDLDNAWATAHTHIIGIENDPSDTGDDEEPHYDADKTYGTKSISRFFSDHIEKNPYKACSRLFCLRKLDPKTDYYAFIVPNYKIAKPKYINGSMDGFSGFNDLAWGTGSTNVQLPVYFQWKFSTSEKGDFESLARMLEPVDADELDMGIREVDASLQWECIKETIDKTIEGNVFTREGALSYPGYFLDKDPYEKLEILKTIYSEIVESLRSEDIEDDTEEDPLVTYPFYGQSYARFDPKTYGTSQHSSYEMGEPSDKDWRNELNYNLRNRLASAFGTKTIQDGQDEYVRESWNQVGALIEANKELRRTRAASQVGDKIWKRHMMKLSDERFFVSSLPFHSHSKIGNSSVRSKVEGSGLSQGIASRVFKKEAMSKIKGERIEVQMFKPFEMATSLSANTADIKGSANVDMAMKLDESAKKILQQPVFKKRTEQIVMTPLSATANLPKGFKDNFDQKVVLEDSIKDRITIGMQPVVNMNDILVVPEFEESMYEPLSELSKDYLLPGLETLPNNSITLAEENRAFIESYMVGLNHEMGRELVWREYPARRDGTYFKHFWNATTFNIKERKLALKDDITEIKDWDKLGENIPGTDETVRQANLTRHKSVIDDFQEKNEARLVLIIKGDLIRRYPATIIYAQKIKGEYWSEAIKDKDEQDRDLTPGEEYEIIEPIFRAWVGEDILFVGFPISVNDIYEDKETNGDEYYFILQENQDLPRFGLDVQTRSTRLNFIYSQNLHPYPFTMQEVQSVAQTMVAMEVGSSPSESVPERDDLSWGDVSVPSPGKYIDFNGKTGQIFEGASESSSMFAYLTFQKPMRIAVHASQMGVEGVDVDKSRIPERFGGLKRAYEKPGMKMKEKETPARRFRKERDASPEKRGTERTSPEGVKGKLERKVVEDPGFKPPTPTKEGSASELIRDRSAGKTFEKHSEKERDAKPPVKRAERSGGIVDRKESGTREETADRKLEKMREVSAPRKRSAQPPQDRETKGSRERKKEQEEIEKKKKKKLRTPRKRGSFMRKRRSR